MKLFFIALLFSLGFLANAGDRTVIQSLNGEWKIKPPVKSSVHPGPEEGIRQRIHLPETSTADWKKIKVPHSSWHHEFPDTYPDASKRNANYQFVGKSVYVSGWFATEFELGENLGENRIYLDFGAVAFECVIFVNGKELKRHKGSFTGFEVDVTDAVKPGKNDLRLWVTNDFGELPPRHVYGKMFMASSNIGGIVGDVKLKIVPPVNIKRTLITPRLEDNTVDVTLEVRNYLESGQYTITPGFTSPDGTEQSLDTKSYSLKKGENRISLRLPLKSPQLWSPDTPRLYFLNIQIAGQSGQEIFRSSERFGFRDFRAIGNKFYLNGERIRIYCGNILTDSAWQRFSPGSDMEFRMDLKRQKESNVNTIRYHMGGSNSHLLLAIADEMGFLVVDEFPMFHRVFHDLVFKNEAQRKEFMDTTTYEWRERIMRDYNHPSAVIWTLSNEVWTDSTADELTELYQALKPLDPMRPFNTGSGLHSFGIPSSPVPSDIYDSHLYNVTSMMAPNFAKDDFDRYFKGLEALYGKTAYEKPAAVFECLSVGHRKPRTLVPFDRAMNVEQYLETLKANKTNDIRWFGLRAYLAQKLPEGREFVDAVVDWSFEEFRKDSRFQGYHIWTGRRNIIYDGYKEKIKPLFVAAENLKLNVVTGEELSFEAIIINDSMKSKQTTLHIATLRNGVEGQTMTLPLELPEGRELVRLPIRFQPGTEQYDTLKLRLQSKDEKAENSYAVNVKPPVDPYKPVMERQAAKWDFKSGRLKELPLPELKDPKLLGGLGALIISAETDTDGAELTAMGGVLERFVRSGGKLLLLNLPSGHNLNWILPGYSLKSRAALPSSASTLLEPAAPDHPVFTGLTANDLIRGLNGDRNIVGRIHLYPLTANLLGTGFPYNNDGPGMLIAEFGIGKGSVVVSQVELLARLNADPVAARLFANLINYTGAEKIAGKPITKGEESQLREFFKQIPAADCLPLKLDKIANRNFVDDPNGERGWTNSGIPDFRQGPKGEQHFFNVPYHMTGRALIMCGTRTADFPKQAALPLEKTELLRGLMMFHTSWFPQPGKELYHVLLQYVDGGEAKIPVIGNENIGDWYSPFERPDTAVAFREKHPQVQAEFGYYATMLINPEPWRPVRSIGLVSAKTGTPIILAMTAVRLNDFATAILKDPWDLQNDDFDRSYGLKKISNTTVELTQGHGWIAPNLRGRELDAQRWKMIRFSLKSSAPDLKVKLLYQSPSGDNATSAGLKPEIRENGVMSFEVDLSKVVWQHSSSPEAKQWGGRTNKVSMFAIDLYGETGTQIEFGPITLTEY